MLTQAFSDAPATSYGAGVAVLYHAVNGKEGSHACILDRRNPESLSTMISVAVFAGLVSFLIRYAKGPKAKYSISAAGLFQFWLGLGLASRW